MLALMGVLRGSGLGLCLAALLATTLPAVAAASTDPAVASDPVPAPASQTQESPQAQVPPNPDEIVAEVGRREDVQVVTLTDTGGGLELQQTPVEGRREAQQEVAEALDDPALIAVDVDTRVRQFGVPDPLSEDQWGMSTIGASAAWATSRGAGTVVAVVDSGVDADHPDLAGAVLPGINTRANRGDTSSPGRDVNGHGTHVAGVIAARADNGEGGSGVAPEASILPIKVLDKYGGGWVSDVTEGIIWAVDHGAHVINLSLGGDDSNLIRSAVEYALASGTVVVAAAGNEATDTPSYPAALDGVLSVAAIGSDGKPAGYSNYGSTIDLQAPGDQILSSVPGGYGAMSGTSMAAPFVSGAAALVRSVQPAGDTAATLLATARRNPLASSAFGIGLVDPVAAVGGSCAPGCAGFLPEPASDSPIVLQQTVSSPVRVKVGSAKRLPTYSDLGVEVRRWRSKSPGKCSVKSNLDGWWVIGNRSGLCRIKVRAPHAEGVRRLKETVRVRVVAKGWRRLPA